MEITPAVPAALSVLELVVKLHNETNGALLDVPTVVRSVEPIDMNQAIGSTEAEWLGWIDQYGKGWRVIAVTPFRLTVVWS